jgi:hypothetical protein
VRRSRCSRKEEQDALAVTVLWSRDPPPGVCRGNVTIQVQLPNDREMQRNIAEKVIAGLG